MSMKILLVDDDTEFMEACRNFLEAAGHEVACENDDRKALARIREFGPDLLLLDVVMSSETSGFAIARELADDAQLSRLPVILLTGYFQRAGASTTPDEALARWKNVRYVLDKPVRPSTLLQVIAQLASEERPG